MEDRKAQSMGIGGISSGALALIVTGLILVFGVIILSQFGDLDVIESGSDAEGAYNDTLDSVTGFSDWLPIVGLLIIAGIVLYLVIRAFPRTQ